MGDLVSLLRERGIVSMEVRFAGSGDEGSVQSVFVQRKILGEEGFRIVSEEVEYRDDLWEEANMLVEHADYDWYNNEGGQGSVTVDAEAGTATFLRSYNEIVERELPELVVEV
jgi:hypothetical protein